MYACVIADIVERFTGAEAIIMGDVRTQHSARVGATHACLHVGMLSPLRQDAGE